MNVINTIIDSEPTVNTEPSLTHFVASKTELPEEIVTKLFHKFISNAETILSTIEKEFEDAVALKMAIHSLKGICGNLYLTSLRTLCEAFERDLSALTPDQINNRLKELREETLRTIKQMKSELP